jgi:hypothetical protein
MTEDPLTMTPPPPPPGVHASPTVPPPSYDPRAVAPPGVKRGQSTVALVLGCFSLLFYFTLIVPALAVGFGTSAIVAQRKAGQSLDGMAVAGVVLGTVFGLLGLLSVLLAAGA